MYIWRNIDVRSCYHCCSGKKKRLLHNLTCVCRYPACNTQAPYCHLRPAPLYNVFPPYQINSTIFNKKKLPDTKYLQLLSEIFLILRRNERDMIKMYICLHVNYPFIWMKFEFFSIDFWNILKYKISWKSVPWEPSCSMRTGGHMTKLIVAFRNFTNAPNYSKIIQMLKMFISCM